MEQTFEVKSDGEVIISAPVVVDPTALKKSAILTSLLADATVLDACKAAGVGRTQFYRWISPKEPYYDADFAEAVARLDSVRIDIAEDALFKNVQGGNLGAQIFWLCNRSGDRWKNTMNSRVEHVLPIEVVGDRVAAQLAAMNKS